MHSPDTYIVSGHRGDCIHGDENTMRAFRRAVAAGVDMIETDVRMTKDGELILMHDAHVETTTDGTGLVKEHTLKELRKLNAAVHSTGPFEPVPTLEEFLSFADENPELWLIIEFKDTPSEGDLPFVYRCVDKICEALLAHGVGKRTYICSFSGKLVEYVYNKCGNAFHYHAFYPWFIMGDMERAPESFCEIACMQHRYQDASGKIIKYEEPLCPEDWYGPLLEKGIMPIMAPSLHDTKKYMLAYSWGSRMVNHDDPYSFLEMLRKRGLHR